MNTLTALLLTQATQTWHASLVQRTVEVAMVVIICGILACIFRLLRGPHLADRALAVDIVAVHLIGLVILLSLWLGSLVFFDGILVLSLLGFAGTVAMAQYIGRPYVKKAPSPPSESTET
jgi:multisubunit Na+/H+ antiporter MnhF subunit